MSTATWLIIGCIVTVQFSRIYRLFEHSPGIPAPPERSLQDGGTRQTITGSRRTARNFFPRLTKRGSTPSAAPMSTSTTWSSA